MADRLVILQVMTDGKQRYPANHIVRRWCLSPIEKIEQNEKRENWNASLKEEERCLMIALWYGLFRYSRCLPLS